jgi:hypothetical protein
MPGKSEKDELVKLARGIVLVQGNTFIKELLRKNNIRIGLSGQVKTGQWWSGQNRPTDAARDVILLSHFLLVRQVRLRAPAPWPAFQDVTVV